MSGGAGPQSAGKFITLEGGEGAGKSTQIRLLSNALERAGQEAVTTREPGGAPGAEIIRSLLVEGAVDRWQPMTEALLHFAARVEHVQATIMPALAAGRWVISDRFSDSTVAYQGYGHDLGQSDMAALHKLVLGEFQPDLTVILDIPVEDGLARAGHRETAEGEGEDRYERMGNDFHSRLRDGFLDIARRNPERCAVLDAAGTPEKVHAEILDLVEIRLGRVLT
ncbi:MAG: dTMP kinase [Rhodospirillales bacterium]|nr:dTMP kinase [Alphaproteobacteria bacterium]MBL6948750.1 dTMP kinase [Rhodospirillales bacterium]